MHGITRLRVLDADSRFTSGPGNRIMAIVSGSFSRTPFSAFFAFSVRIISFNMRQVVRELRPPSRQEARGLASRAAPSLAAE